jgi:hypothetical protein
MMRIMKHPLTGEYWWYFCPTTIAARIRALFSDDRLWVRESWARTKVAQDACGADWFVYRECDNFISSAARATSCWASSSEAANGRPATSAPIERGGTPDAFGELDAIADPCDNVKSMGAAALTAPPADEKPDKQPDKIFRRQR